MSLTGRKIPSIIVLFFLFSLMDRIQSIVGQKIVIYNKDRKILILRTSKNRSRPWTWDLPGWWLLRNEGAISSLEREIVEETWLKNVEWIRPIHTVAKSNTYDENHSFFVGYIWRVKGDISVVLSDEHDEYLRIDPNGIDTYTMPSHRAEVVKKSMKK